MYKYTYHYMYQYPYMCMYKRMYPCVLNVIIYFLLINQETYSYNCKYTPSISTRIIILSQL